jgi:signal transduction histidine kinase
MMPAELNQQLRELEQWAVLNQDEANSDVTTFWALKIPAILASACAGVVAYFDLKTFSVLLGAIASICVIVDGVHPRGMLRNVHLRAYHDIRILSTSMVAQWRSRDSRFRDRDIARKIIRDAEEERQRIAAYIRDAETSLKFKGEA